MTLIENARRHRGRWRGVAVAAAAAATGMLAMGCTSVIPGATAEPPKIYDLTPKSTFDSKIPKVRWQLVVDQPSAPAT